MSDLQLHAKWEDVAGGFQGKEISLEETLSHFLYHEPKKILQILSVYKFIAKMASSNRSILQLGINQAIGPLVFEKENKSYVGLSMEATRLKKIQENWRGLDLKLSPLENYSQKEDVLFFDFFASESSYKDEFLLNPEQYVHLLQPEGLVFLGSEDKNELMKIKSTLSSHFRFQFIFSIFGENIQPGLEKYADYLLLMNCL